MPKSLFQKNVGVILVLIAGIGYLFALQLLVPKGAFITGDSGLKALLAQNLATGNSGLDIKFADPSWVKDLWGQGLFPYQEPFMYDIAGKYYITFAYPFSLISAPFYSLWGYRGLYAIPWLSILGVWIFFLLFCRKLELNRLAVAIGSLLLIFATNLSLYSALFWEHAPAVFFSFAALYWMFPGKGRRAISGRDAALAGFFSSLAVWFRDEQILLVIFLGFISLISLVKSLRPGLLKFDILEKMTRAIGKSGWIYLLSAFLTLFLYGLSNLVIYHHFFGVHSLQVIAPQSLHERLSAFITNLRLLTVGYYSLFLYVPIALFPFIYLLFAWIKPGQAKNEPAWALGYVLCPFFILGVAILVPSGAGGKQWGPRLLLFLVPVLVLLFTWQLDHLVSISWPAQKVIGRIELGLVLAAAIIGIIQNPVRGSEFLGQNYSQAKATIDELHAEAQPVVAVSDQFLTQTFQPAVSRNTIFLEVANEDRLSIFVQALDAQNLHSFSYLCFSNDCKLFKIDQKTKQVNASGASYEVDITRAKEYGLFTIFDMQIGD